AVYMQLRNIELCRKGEAGSVVINGAKSEAGAAVFGQGSFPPIRIQVPASPQYTPAQPESKEQIVEGLNMVLAKMKEMGPTLEEISPQMTVAHPRLGELNAKEWFSLVEMHYRHHLHQKDRLKQFLETI
ncbi:DinB family protein, partial [Brevibacillus sp. SYSU BS000544]|uniref:DinB family protein n=1 Tax=Brevibacillus sp. SYSU BS000544 TaxID=3416443 RepID=UPI003CE44E9F